jgi:DNA-3-methyladenine glycosylase
LKASGNRKLPRDFYARGTLAVARELLGKWLVLQNGPTRRIGRIVETEAYMGPRDLAAHSSRGRTPRTEVMFGPPGHAYVYFIYGFWNCLNVVTAPEGIPHAVLLRALEPVAGVTDSTWGPGLLCRAMGIDRTLNGADLCGEELWIENPGAATRAVRVGRSPRIGVDYAGSWAGKLWRFFDRDSPYVSTVTRRALTRDRRQLLSPAEGTRTKIPVSAGDQEALDPYRADIRSARYPLNPPARQRSRKRQ